MAKGKIILDIPGYYPITLEKNVTVESILETIDAAELSQLDLLDVRLYVEYDDEPVVEKDDEEDIEVAEAATQRNKDTIMLDYDIPKSIAFTQKFQNRIRDEIPDVIDSVYPGLYDVTNFTFKEDTPTTMKLTIQIKALTNDAVRNMSYLDENVNYIVENIIDYYNK